MPTRRLVFRQAIRSGAGRHERCRTGERQQLRRSMEQDVEAYFDDEEACVDSDGYSGSGSQSPSGAACRARLYAEPKE